MSDYIGRHRGRPIREAWPPMWPPMPPGFDAYGQPVCTCPMTVGDLPAYSADCRKHGHLPRRLWAMPS